MQPKARMTFRFEQQAQPPKNANRQPINQVSDDIHALEELIRHTDSVMQQPIIPEQLEQADLDENREWQGGDWLSPPAPIREGPSWGRVILSVSAAVATGALFGYIVLSLFTGESLFPGKANHAAVITDNTVTRQPDVPTVDSSAIPQESITPSESGGETVLSQVPAQVYYLLQYGVFHSEESMQTAIKELGDKGRLFATEHSDDYRVYIGAAATRDEAELLAAQMPGVEVYIKPIQLDSIELSNSELPVEMVDFLNATTKLTDKLIQGTGDGLQGKGSQVIVEGDSSSFELAHKQWLSTVSITDKLNGRASEEANGIIKALNSAMLAMVENSHNPSRYQLWTAQSSVMKAVIADRRLRAILQPAANG